MSDNMTIEEMRNLRGKQKRQAALSLYLTDLSLSIRKVGEMMDIREGTVLRWSHEDQWKAKRDEDMVKRQELLREKITVEEAEKMYTVMTNHLQRALIGSNDENISLDDIDDLKRNVEIIEKLSSILSKSLQMKDAPQDINVNKNEPELEELTEEDLITLLNRTGDDNYG